MNRVLAADRDWSAPSVRVSREKPGRFDKVRADLAMGLACARDIFGHTSRYLLRAVLVPTLFVVSGSLAHAGHYDVTYSGGTATTIPGSQNTGYYLNSNDGTYRGSAYVGDVNATAKCEGEITATLTWVPDYPDEPFPRQVVIVEDAAASYFAQSYGPNQGGSSADCGDGMGHPKQGNPMSNPYGFAWFESSSGRNYSVKSGAATITMSRSPFANCQMTQGASLHASGMYKCVAYPVLVGVQGTVQTSDGDAAILIGQGATSNLVCGGATFQNVSWEVTGGKPFVSFNVSSNQLTGSVDWNVNLNVLNPHWYYSKDGESTVVGKADAYASDGTYIGRVEGERKVYIHKPFYYLSYNSSGAYGAGCYFGDNFSNVQSGNPPPNQMPGMQFFSRVQTPALFAHQGKGWQQFAQLINDSTSHWLFGYPFDTGSTSNDENWLDNNYPYLNEGPVPASITSSGGTWQAEDSPIEAIQYSSSDLFIVDRFQTFLMYQPPPVDFNNPDVQWVPLLHIDWEWNVSTGRTTPFSAWSPNPPGTTEAYGGFSALGDWGLEWTGKCVNTP